MNQMTTATGGGAIAALSKLKAGLAGVAATLPKAGGDPILRLLKDGTWVYGQENIEVQSGSRWAANILSIEHGFVSWTRYSDVDRNDRRKDELVGERMVPFTQPQPSRAELPDTGWDWTEQVSVLFQCLDGEDEGTVVIYKPTSVGGIGYMRKLIDKIMAQLDADEKHPVPVVTFETEHYDHKRYGKTYVPALNIVEWVALDDPNDTGTSAPEPEDGGGRDQPAQQAEQVTAAAPVRRRPAAEEQTAAAPRRAPVNEAPQPAPADSGVVRRRRSL